MGKINWGKVVLGGLVAGIIIDVVEGIVEGVILGPEWREAMKALGRPLRETGTNVTLHILLGFAYGITALWLYAAIRPRFGAGPRTALYAGICAWVLGNLLPSVNWGPQGVLPSYLFAIAALVGLVEMVVATEAGAWLYQE